MNKQMKIWRDEVSNGKTIIVSQSCGVSPSAKDLIVGSDHSDGLERLVILCTAESR